MRNHRIWEHLIHLSILEVSGREHSIFKQTLNYREIKANMATPTNQSTHQKMLGNNKYGMMNMHQSINAKCAHPAMTKQIE